MALVVAALAVLLGTGSSAGASSGTGLQQQFDRRTALTSAARQFSVNFFTYDYRNLNKAFQVVEAQSGGAFLKDYQSKEGQLRTLLPQARVVASSTVSAAGVSIIARDQGIVLVTVDQNVSNVLKKSAQNRYRIKLTMQETPKGWVAVDVTPVT